jgi:nitrous oxidase accessory protein NosD
MKKLIAIIVCMLLIITFLPVSGTVLVKENSIPFSLENKTLYVGGIGPWNYTFIQEAINDAEDCDTVFVLDDSSPYYENLKVNKSINLFGENKYTTVIDGMRKTNVIEIESDDVYIRGFTIKNSALTGGAHNICGIHNYSYSGHKLDHVKIEDNILTDNWYGIHFVRPYNLSVINNEITGNAGIGFHNMLGDNITLTENEITSNGNDAMFCVGASNSTISNNIVMYNDKGGVNVQFRSNHTLIENNIILYNTKWMALWIVLTGDTTVRNNVFNNDVTVEIEVYDWSIGNHIYHNDFYNYPWDYEGRNNWDNGYPSGGNYWSVYEGEDNFKGPLQNIPGSDGIGDTPFYFNFDVDWYPLMEPFIENLRPKAKFTYSVYGKYVLFDASSSYDLDGNIVSYEWDFGDSFLGIGESIPHSYDDFGAYNVTLTITDNKGLKDTESWEVILIKEPKPYIYCDKSLNWENVRPGKTVEGSIIVENVGGSGTLLDWEIVEWPEWGEWTFTPLHGDDLTPEEGEFIINVSVVAPDEKKTHFDGEIKITNKDSIYDFCIVDVFLSTPKNDLFFYNFPLLNLLLERFPLLQKILDVLRLNSI